MRRISILIAIVILISLFAFIKQKLSLDDRETLTIITYDGFNAPPELIQKFEQKNKVKVKFLCTRGSILALNQAILNDRIADIFFGVSSTNLKKALDASIFKQYDSPMLSQIPEEFKLDPQNRLVPIAFGDVCLNYDITWFENHNLKPPESLEDLIKPEYKDLMVFPDPSISLTGMNFVLGTIQHFGEEHYLDFWRKLKKNGLFVASSFSESYNSRFSYSVKGGRPIVVSYSGSPVREVIKKREEGVAFKKAPTRAVVGNGVAFRDIEFAGILRGSKNVKLAQKFIDFMLSKQYQENIPLQIFIYPVNKEAVLPEVFLKYATKMENPPQVDYNRIAKKREYWIEKWVEIVLK